MEHGIQRFKKDDVTVQKSINMKQILVFFILAIAFQMCGNKHSPPAISCNTQLAFILDSLEALYEFEEANINSYHYDSNSLSAMYTEDIVKVELFNAYSINNENKDSIAYEVIKAVYPYILNKDDFSRFEVGFIFPDETDICSAPKEVKISYTMEEFALPQKLGTDFDKICLERVVE